MSSRLVYLMGASGSGKDSVIQYVRQHLDCSSPVVFAHRYITRPAESEGENHIALSQAEFDARLQSGLLAMHWQSHGLHYGIGIEIHTWLAKGMNVIVNGSREYLPIAQTKYPEIYPVHITVKPDTLMGRLLQRGRETEVAIRRRLERHREIGHRPIMGACIDNNGPLEQAGEQLLALLRCLENRQDRPNP